MHKAETKTKEYLEQNDLLPSGSKVLLAISGGADSVALLYILNRFLHKNLFIAHINHQLRGQQSDADEKYVISLSEKLNLPIEIKSVDVKNFAKEKKLSIETAARELRIEALCQIADKNNCEIIATAHHKNDNAETVLHRMLRGTGFRGLAGIRPKTNIKGKIFIRPLLCLTRDEIEDYLKSEGIDWQIDHTNLDVKFTRNRIRHRLIPYLLKESPNLIEEISDLSLHCATLTKNIETFAESVRKKCFISEENKKIVVDMNIFLQQPAPVEVELIRTGLMHLGVGLREYAFEHYKKIVDFIKTAFTGKTLTIPGTVKILKGYDRFFIIAFTAEEEKSQEIFLNVPGRTIFEGREIQVEILENVVNHDIKNKDEFTECFDYEQIKLPLKARYRREGDKFRPFGLDGFKKVGKFLTAQKIDTEVKNNILLIEDAEKDILWVAPIRRSGQAVVNDKRRKILRITIT